MACNRESLNGAFKCPNFAAVPNWNILPYSFKLEEKVPISTGKLFDRWLVRVFITISSGEAT